jgi:hypothetical protein
MEERRHLAEVVAEDDDIASLDALINLVAHELDDNRCAKCQSIQMRSGDTAALVLRLQKLLEDRATRKAEEKRRNPEKLPEGVSSLAGLAGRRNGGAGAANSRDAGLGTKNGPRRQGGRKPRIGSGGAG